jgi:hypothetical protein
VRVDVPARTLAVAAACFLVTFSACPPGPTPDAGCDGALFGQPIAATGLDATKCRPSCGCSGFRSRDFTEAQLDALRSWTLSQPFEELTSDPYAVGAPDAGAAVCAVVVEDLAERRYRLQTYPDATAAAADGAILTHHDACGRCSTLADFAVYAKDRDIGAPVKKCGMDNFGQPLANLVACIERLGFTKPCAQTWAYNVRHTQARCLEPCLLIGDGPYHTEDGALNACLDCDERLSGPVFKHVAGRTRRNTGLASSICRPCAEAKPVPHAYPGL